MKNLTQLIFISATLLTASLSIAKTATRYVCHDQEKATILSLNYIGSYYDGSGTFAIINPEKTYTGNVESSKITIKGIKYGGKTHEDFSNFTLNDNTDSFEMFLGDAFIKMDCESFHIERKTKTCVRYWCDSSGSTAKEYEVIEGYQCPQTRPIPCKT